MSYLLSALLALAMTAPAFAAGRVSGLVELDDSYGCEILHGDDTEHLGCTVDTDPLFKSVRVNFDFSEYNLKEPPICVVTGIPIKGMVGTAGRDGTQPVVTRFSPSKVSFILNGLPFYPCDCGKVAMFNCAISN